MIAAEYPEWATDVAVARPASTFKGWRERVVTSADANWLQRRTFDSIVYAAQHVNEAFQRLVLSRPVAASGLPGGVLPQRIVHIDDRFLMTVNDGGTRRLYYSDDGVSWTLASGIAASTGDFVSVGSEAVFFDTVFSTGSLRLTSGNGTSIALLSNTGVTVPWRTFIGNDNVLVGITSDNRYVRSTDAGATWSAPAAMPILNAIRGFVVPDSQTFRLIGSTGYLQANNQFTAFAVRNTSPTGVQVGNHLVGLGGDRVWYADDDTAYLSDDDGLTWTRGYDLPAGFPTEPDRVVYAEELRALLADNGLVSNTGREWSTRAPGATSERFAWSDSQRRAVFLGPSVDDLYITGGFS